MGLAGVVAHERQPGKRHRHGQLHRRAEAHRLPEGRGVPRRSVEEDDLAEHQREDEERRHGDLVHEAEVRDAYEYPQEDERAYDQAPGPGSRLKDAVRGQGPVVDHDGRPAHELEDVQKREEQPALFAEGELHRLHRAKARPAAYEPREEKQRAAYDMADDDGEDALAHAQGREVGAGQDLRNGDARAEPDEAVLEGGGLFHPRASCLYSGFMSKAWSIGPEPRPRSSIAASAPER